MGRHQLRFRPFPRDAELFTLLTASAAHLVTGAGLLARLLGSDRVRRVELAARLHDVEHAGDEATHAVLAHLGRVFITPYEREDVHRLVEALDDCLDAMDEAARVVVATRVGELPHGVSQQVAVLQRCAELTAAAVPHLRSREGLEEYCVEVNRLENQAQHVYHDILGEVLGDDDGDPLRAQRVTAVAGALEAAADAFERLARAVALLTLKES